jgi:hypothetical protein
VCRRIKYEEGDTFEAMSGVPLSGHTWIDELNDKKNK